MTEQISLVSGYANPGLTRYDDTIDDATTFDLLLFTQSLPKASAEQSGSNSQHMKRAQVLGTRMKSESSLRRGPRKPLLSPGNLSFESAVGLSDAVPICSWARMDLWKQFAYTMIFVRLYDSFEGQVLK
jgi:hypothetical protein